MTRKESQAISRTRGRMLAQAASDQAAGFGGAYAAGRWARNSQIMGYPATLVVGGLAALGMRRGRSLGGKAVRFIMAGAVGAGHYGAGKMGEQHGIEAGNDGNLISWGKREGSDENEFYTD